MVLPCILLSSRSTTDQLSASSHKKEDETVDLCAFQVPSSFHMRQNVGKFLNAVSTS